MTEHCLKVIVAKRQVQGKGVVVLDLVASYGSTLPGFTAGAHIDVHIDDQMIRQYSLSNAPAVGDSTDRYRIGVLKDPAIQRWFSFYL